jgi:cellulose synthase/poly-beta-1,6-N-acetylglucosamine synthase-like glycosyltransferase
MAGMHNVERAAREPNLQSRRALFRHPDIRFLQRQNRHSHVSLSILLRTTDYKGRSTLKEDTMSLPDLGFAACAAFVVYVLAGYPLLLAAWAAAFPKPIWKVFTPRRVSIIIPVRNGAPWISKKLDSLLASNYPPELLDILVVSDGSSDETESLVSSYPDPKVRLLKLPPGGKATAVTRALNAVEGEIVLLTDVRQTFDRDAIRLMVACFADQKVGVVTGELVIRAGSSQEEANTGLYWKYEKWIRRNLNKINAMLGATGSIYAIRRELSVAIPPDILLDDVYVPFTAAFRGYRIYFEDQAKAYDLPTSLNSEFWRKVRTQAGVYQIMQRFPALLSPRNPRFVHFLSHKLGRLLLPYAMLGAFIFSWFLPAPWKLPLLAAQAVFYALALLDPLIPEKNPVKRLSAVIRAFVVLVAAAACALNVFFRPARQLWKETKVETGKSA